VLNAGHPVCRSPIPFNQIVVDKRYWQRYLSIVGSSLFKINFHMSLHLSSKFWKFWHSDVKYVVKISLWFAWQIQWKNIGSHLRLTNFLTDKTSTFKYKCNKIVKQHYLELWTKQAHSLKEGKLRTHLKIKTNFGYIYMRIIYQSLKILSREEGCLN
jgi:hypothetical protein